MTLRNRFMRGYCILAATLAFATMLVSCDFISDFSDNDVVKRAGDGKTGTISISVSPGAARTIVPDAVLSAKSFAVEYVNRTNPGLSGRASLLTGPTLTVPNVYPGTMYLKVYAYSSATAQDASTQIASGTSVDFTLTEGMTKDVSVLLKMTQTATVTTGSISIDLRWPVSTGADTLEARVMDSGNTVRETIKPVVASDGLNYSATVRSTASLESGTYRLLLVFGSNAGIGQPTFTEAVNIFDGAVSAFWINPTSGLEPRRTYTAEDFYSRDNSLRLIASLDTGTPVDLSFSPTGVTQHDFGTTDKWNIRLRPDSLTPGKSVSTSLNGETPKKLIPGEFSTIRLSGGNNVLRITVTAPGGGDGVTYSIFAHITQTEINSQTGLAAMNPNGAYKLTGPIALNAGWVPIAVFSGELDGDGNKITNLTYAFAETDATQGGLIMRNSGTMKNLVVEGANISSASRSQDGTAEANCGLLVGTNTGTIYRCATSGNVNLDGAENFWLCRIGGLAGNNFYPGVIEECYTVATVNTNEGDFVGGLVGTNQSKVLNSYARGAVTGRQLCGGLVGNNETHNGSVVKCYSTGNVTGILGANGGCIGGTDFTPVTGATLTATYYDSDKSGVITGGSTPAESVALHGIPYTTAEMKNKDNFAGWDFDTVWGIDTTGNDNDGYPYLRYFKGINTIIDPPL